MTWNEPRPFAFDVGIPAAAPSHSSRTAPRGKFSPVATTLAPALPDVMESVSAGAPKLLASATERDGSADPNAVTTINPIANAQATRRNELAADGMEVSPR